MKKDYCPGYFDIANGGVMGAEETDEENAQRELEEEVGITGVELKVIENIKYEDDGNRVWGNIFAVQHDCKVEDMKLQEEEVDAILLLDRNEILKKIEEGVKFTPDGILAFKRFIEIEPYKSFYAALHAAPNQ